MPKFILVTIWFYGFIFALSSIHAQENTITIMTYNIHYGIGMDGQKDLKRIAEVIKRENPDIVGLQEVADFSMTAELAGLVGMEGVFGASTEKEIPNLYNLLGLPVPQSQLFYGDAILSKHPFTFIKNLSIPSASSSRYEAMCIEVDLSEKMEQKATIKFITTHFDYLQTIGSDMARNASVEVIEKAFFEDSTMRDFPAILTGDLNATPDSEPLRLLQDKGWILEDLGQALPTVPVDQPSKQIDYILVRPQYRWNILKVKVLDETMASDHLPVVMRLECLGLE